MKVENLHELGLVDITDENRNILREISIITCDKGYVIGAFDSRYKAAKFHKAEKLSTKIIHKGRNYTAEERFCPSYHKHIFNSKVAFSLRKKNREKVIANLIINELKIVEEIIEDILSTITEEEKNIIYELVNSARQTI